MRHDTIRAALACAVLATGLAACGGGDSKDSTSAASTTTPTATTAEPTQTATTEPAPPAGTTAPGTALGLGETAKVTLKPLNEGFDTKTRYRVDVTVEKLEKKSVADLKGVNLDAKQKEAAPYWVTVKVTNAGKTIPADEEPDLRFHGIDDRGQEQNNVIFIGGFKPCDDTKPPKPFSKGKSYKSCHVFLVPGGGSIDQVDWTGTPEYLEKPVSWK